MLQEESLFFPYNQLRSRKLSMFGNPKNGNVDPRDQPSPAQPNHDNMLAYTLRSYWMLLVSTASAAKSECL